MLAWCRLPPLETDLERLLTSGLLELDTPVRKLLADHVQLSLLRLDERRIETSVRLPLFVQEHDSSQCELEQHIDGIRHDCFPFVDRDAVSWQLRRW